MNKTRMITIKDKFIKGNAPPIMETEKDMSTRCRVHSTIRKETGIEANLKAGLKEYYQQAKDRRASSDGSGMNMDQI